MLNLEKMAQFYYSQYGEKTQELFAAMLKPIPKLALANPFIPPKNLANLFNQAASHHILGLTTYETEHKPELVNGLLSHYFLDRSSLLAPLMLPLNPGAKVLDMCSAPGGKLLVLLSRHLNLQITANDLSPNRANRLRKVIQAYLPPNEQASIKVTNKDGVWFGLSEANCYDAVLLDAPCSSEAHVINDQKLLKQFTGLKKNLPQRQYSLLCAAILATKPGGYIMYATCSINHHENEALIAKALRKKAAYITTVELNSPLGSSHSLGTTVLPHLHKAGPAFLCLLKRT